MALGFNHAKTNDEKLAPRRPFAGLRADKWQVIVLILIQNEQRTVEMGMHVRCHERAGDLEGYCAVE
jgi:hypothetical protein